MIRGPRVSLLLVMIMAILGLATVPAQAGSVSMAWDAGADPDLVGYRVFYGPAAGNYDQQIDVGLVTDHMVTGLTDCATWHVAVKALDSAGNVSAGFSNEISGWPRPTVATARRAPWLARARRPSVMHPVPPSSSASRTIKTSNRP